MDFSYKLLSSSSKKFLSLSELFTKACSSKIVWFGEYHSEERITVLLEQLIRNYDQKNLHIVWEHFSLEMNPLLQDYQSNQHDFEGLVEAYRKIGTEGHDLKPYRSILDYCQQQSSHIQMHGGFIPRPHASAFMKADDKRLLYQELSGQHDFVPNLKTLETIQNTFETTASLSNNFQLYGSPDHYNLFESLLSGREIYSPQCPPPDEARRGIFQAQLLKDYAMAYEVSKLVARYPPDDKFLVVAGKGHLSHYCGVPEIYSWLQQDSSSSPPPEDEVDDELLICAQMMYELDELDDHANRNNDEKLEHCILENEVIHGSMLSSDKSTMKRPVSDVLYIYNEQDWSDDEDSDDDDDNDETVRNETMEAYNKVGATASTPGNASKARAILTYLGYSSEEQEWIGPDDIYNYQGVGNPFPLANIQKGDSVIDLGSGLGVDSFLAAKYCSESGNVLGIDMAHKEVQHATRRAQERGLESYVCFQQSTIEKLDNIVDSNSFHVAISNGAFCLVPQKEEAFRQVYRLLRPGGRMAICTTTVRKDLNVETQWPLCMRMFVHLDQLKPMCEEIGFINVNIDLSDSELEFELEEEEDETNHQNGTEREKIHVGSDEFRHLQDYNMNELCARVVVYGVKPLES